MPDSVIRTFYTLSCWSHIKKTLCREADDSLFKSEDAEALRGYVRPGEIAHGQSVEYSNLCLLQSLSFELPRFLLSSLNFKGAVRRNYYV